MNSVNLNETRVLSFAHRFGAAFILIGLLSGCGQIREHYIVNAAAVPDADFPSTGYDDPGPLDLSTLCFENDKFNPPKMTDGEEDDIQCNVPAYRKVLAASVNPGPTDNPKQMRNNLQDLIIRRSDVVCHVHQGSILANSASLNFGFDLANNVLSSLSAVFTPVTTKTALSASSAIVGFGGTGIKAEFYQNLFASAIVGEIDKARAKKLESMADHRTQSIMDYSMDQAINEVAMYHHLCSFYEGVVALTKDDKPDVMTRAQIDNEIDALRAENAKLRLTAIGLDSGRVLDASIQQIDKDAANSQMGVNNARIFQLQSLRPTAPGSAAEPVEEGNLPDDLNPVRVVPVVEEPLDG